MGDAERGIKDGEKEADTTGRGDAVVEGTESSVETPSQQPNGVTKWMKNYSDIVEKHLVKHHLEARGIQRVPPEERHSLQTLGYSQIALMWTSFNLTAINITLGMLGPAVYYLSFLDAAMCAVFGMLFGTLSVAYIATFGPRSGNRTMIIARYAMGWYPAKIVGVLNIINFLGYSLIDSVIAGQILSAVSTKGISIVAGIIIVAVITWIVSTFGYRFFHYYECYAWLPQIVMCCILAGAAGLHFDTSTSTSAICEGCDTRTIIGSRLSFFSLAFAGTITYTGGAADFLVYYPENTNQWKIAAATIGGISFSCTFAYLLGIGLASGIASSPAWASAYKTSQGALIVAGFQPLGTFGSFCSVVVALGMIANMIPPAYSSGIDFQILSRYFIRIPRAILNTIGVVVYTACALAGREHLSEIFTNFLALMSYWTSIWIAITVEEQLLFHRGKGFDWDAWNRRDSMPFGLAAFVAFVVGWVGAVLCMAQVWFIGPIAGLLGEFGADMGNYVGFAWAALVFPPLRWLELKRFER